jgi:signal peptidase I
MNSYDQRQARRTIERIARGALLLLVGFAAAAFLLLAIVPRLGWYRPLTVLSGSMGPTFSPGDLILVRPEPLRDVRVGQVISFQAPIGAHQVETHRVIKLVRRGDRPIVRTQGDANDRPDPWTAELHGSTAWREAVVIPYAGYAIHGLRSRALRLSAVIVAPALIALLILLDLWVPGTRGRERHATS